MHSVRWLMPFRKVVPEAASQMDGDEGSGAAAPGVDTVAATGLAGSSPAAATEAVARQPKWAEAHLTLARAQLNSGVFLRAVHHFYQVLELDPSLEPEVREDLDNAKQLRWEQVVSQWEQGGGHCLDDHLPSATS